MSSPFAKINDLRGTDREIGETAPAQSRMDAASAAARVDGWFSSLAGYGIEGRDKRMSARFQGDRLDDQTIEDLWRSDDMASRIVEVVPDEAMRPGYELNVGDKKLAEELAWEMEELGVDDVLRQAKKIERAFGGAAIFPVINDTQKAMSQPLNEDRIQKIEHLQVFEARELRPSRYYSNPLRPKFGEPETYLLFPQARGTMTSYGGVEIHESRLVVFPGIRVSRSQTATNLWGDSVLNRVYGILRDYNLSWAATTALLHDFAQAAFKIKGLAQLIAQDRDDVIRTRIQMVDLARSTIRAVLMDAEEEFERKSTPVNGLAELLTAMLTRVAAAADMPVTRLFGQAPAGLSATGEHEIRQWYDRVDTIRRLGMKPQLSRLICLQMKSRSSVTRGKEPKRWSVEFKPLWQMSEKEKADHRKVVAETDNIYVQMMAVSPEEVALSRWGGDDYSAEMNVNFKERAFLNELGETVVPPPPTNKGGAPGEEPPPGAPSGDPSAPPGAPDESVPSGAEPKAKEPPPFAKKGEEEPTEEPTGEKKPPVENDDGTPAEAVIEEVDEDGDPETAPAEYVTISVKGHARKIRLRRKRTESADRQDSIAQALLDQIADEFVARMDEKEWDPELHPKDESGKFTSTGGGGGSKDEKKAAAKEKVKAAIEAYNDLEDVYGDDEDSQSDPYHPLSQANAAIVAAKVELAALDKDDFSTGEDSDTELTPADAAAHAQSKFVDTGEGLELTATQKISSGASKNSAHRSGRAKFFVDQRQNYLDKAAKEKDPAKKEKHLKAAEKSMKLAERHAKAAAKYAKDDKEKALAQKAAQLVKDAKGGKAPASSPTPSKPTSNVDKMVAENEAYKKEQESKSKELGKPLDEAAIKAAGLQYYPGQKVFDPGGDHLVVHAISGAEYKVDKETKKFTETKPKPAPPPPGPQTQTATKVAGEIVGTQSPEPGSELEGKLKELEAAKPKSLDQFYAERTKLTGKLTPGEKKAALTYSGSAYSSINSALRSDKMPSGHQTTVKNLDSMFDRPDVITKEDQVVYRGMGSAKLFEGAGPGTEFVDKGYMSTSVKKESAFGGDVALAIHVPKGSRAATIPSKIPSENETLLPRGTRLEILKIEKVKSPYGGMKTVIHARAHTDGGKSAPTKTSAYDPDADDDEDDD